MYTKEQMASGKPVNSPIPPERQIEVHVSCSAPSAFSVDPNDPNTPWGKYVTYHPMIEHVSTSTIHFEDETTLDDVDVVIYATGYNFALPFAKFEDRPWCDNPIFNGKIGSEERMGGDTWEEKGMKGLGVKGLDELMLFLEGDRSICFPVLREYLRCHANFSLPWQSIKSFPFP